jgi:NADPH2:quinone reductase
VTWPTSVVGVLAGGYSRAELDRIHAELARLIDSGRLQNAVTASVRFADLPTARQRLADRKVIGRMVMVTAARRPAGERLPRQPVRDPF